MNLCFKSICSKKNCNCVSPTCPLNFAFTQQFGKKKKRVLRSLELLTTLQSKNKNKTYTLARGLKKKTLFHLLAPLGVAIERKKSLELACPMQTSTKNKKKMLQSPCQL